MNSFIPTAPSTSQGDRIACRKRRSPLPSPARRPNSSSRPTPARSAQHCKCTARCAKVPCSAVTHGSHPARVRCLLTHASQPNRIASELESNAYNPPESERSRKTNHMHKQRIGAYIAKARAKGPGGHQVPSSHSTQLRALSIDPSSRKPETRRGPSQ